MSTIKKHYIFTLFSVMLIFTLGATISMRGETDLLTIDEMLQIVPISLRTERSIFEGYQAIMDIHRNMQMMYGASCVVELNYMELNRPERYPSLQDDFVPLKVTKETTLREFLDYACSKGNMTWAVVRNAIHVWPTTKPSDKEEYLDTVKMSLDLQGVSLLEAVKAWAHIVNEKRSAQSQGVRVSHPTMLPSIRSYATPESLTCNGVVTLKVENVTAREALCAIQGCSKEWVQIIYLPANNTSKDDINLVSPNSEILGCPEITAEERARLNTEEDLGSVLVEPEAKSGSSG